MHRRISPLFLLLFFAPISWAQSPKRFVRVSGHQLLLQGRPYYFIGANYWCAGLLGNDEAGKARIKQELDFLAKNGVSYLRILGGAEGRGIIHGADRVGPPLQPDKGMFDTSILRGLDFLLAEMNRRQLRAVIYLSNNWEWSGGFLQYLNWNGQLADSDLKRPYTWDENRDFGSRFYSCKPCLEQYAAQAALIINRRNTVTGQLYKNDPAIMAWEIANEPRPMRPAAIPVFVSWISKTAAFIKSLDPNHLVTTGSEGDLGSERMDIYQKIHSDKNIDYATIHIWPKNWGWFRDTAIGEGFSTSIKNTNDYIYRHLAALKPLNKPLILEEFGLPRNGLSFQPGTSTSFRDQYYSLYFERVLKSRKAAGIIAGASFWAFGGIGRPSGKKQLWSAGDDWLGDPPTEEQGLNSVFVDDSTTWRIIGTYSKRIAGGK